MKKHCDKCGHLLDEETGFCPSCEEELYKEARKYLEAEDGVPQDREKSEWRQSIFDDTEILDDHEEPAIEREQITPVRTDVGVKKKKRILPLALVVLVCIAFGAGSLLYFGGGRDNRADQSGSSGGQTEQSAENARDDDQTETTEPTGPAFSLSERKLTFARTNDDSQFIREKDNKKYYSNQLIVIGDGSKLISAVGDDMAGREASATQSGATIYDSRVIGTNDFDQSALLRWDVALSEEQVEQLRQEIMRHEGVKGVALNYVIDTNEAMGETEADRTWALDVTGSGEMKSLTEKNLKDSSIRIGYVGPSSGADAVETYLKEVCPNKLMTTLVRPESEIDSSYALTYSLTRAIMPGSAGQNCDVIYYSVGGKSTKKLSNAIIELDKRLSEANEENGNEQQRAIICYPQKELNDAAFGEMEHIKGISVAPVVKGADGSAELSDKNGESVEYCDILSPSLAIVAGFSADTMAINQDCSAKECRDEMLDSATTEVTYSQIRRMINSDQIEKMLSEESITGEEL